MCKWIPLSQPEHPPDCGMECPICMQRCYDVPGVPNGCHFFPCEKGDCPCACGKYKNIAEATL